MVVYFVKPGNLLNNYSNEVIINRKNETQPVQTTAGKMQPEGLKTLRFSLDKLLKKSLKAA